MNDTSINPPAWYKQFWPWFLIALPMTAVIGSMITINIAFTDRDGLVKDDYYKEGLAMNINIARKKLAENLGIEASGTFNIASGTISVHLNDASIGNPDSMHLKLIHPTRADNDMLIELQRQSESVFTGSLTGELKPGNWWVRLTPPDDTWYIEGRTVLPTDPQVRLQ